MSTVRSIAIVWVVAANSFGRAHGFQQLSPSAARIYPQQAQQRSILSLLWLSASPSERSASETSPPVQADPNAAGLYKKFADHAFDELLKSGLFEELEVPQDLATNQAPAKGMPNSVVRISTQALVPSSGNENLVQYSRITLLETVPAASSEATAAAVHVEGIQVLNFVVLPSASTTLPVLGIDLVSLPGGRHLLLLDAQPMVSASSSAVEWEDHWQGWYEKHVVANNNGKFPWGGDFPEPVQQYVSKHSLWTRLQEVEHPTDVIQEDVWAAFVDHLDAYIKLLGQYQGDGIETVLGDNHQVAYLEYRRGNDPAKPMLNSLFGAEWTDQLLDEVLFPKI